MHAQSRRPGTLTARRPIERPKAKAWSHQDDLAALKGRQITVQMITGKASVGTLLEADAFTIKVRTSEGDEVVLFKHIIAAFTAVV